MDLEEKLGIAWKRIKLDRKTDFIISNFEYEVFDRFKDELIHNLSKRWENEGKDYKSQGLRTIRVPKISNTTRPGAVPVIDDRLVYQFLVDEIAEAIEPNLFSLEDKVVHSYRYSGKRTAADMFRFDTASYKTYLTRIEELSESYTYLIVTDISSYFERIYHHELDAVLRELGAPAFAVDSLMSLLRKWRIGNSYSIPQGIWPSDYLGNVYLDPIDKYMVRSGYSYCRFVDDICIGAETYREAQGALLTLEEQLARLGLGLNAAKTKIIPSDNLYEHMFPFKSRFDQIFKELRESVPDFAPYWEPEPDEIEETVKVPAIQMLFTEQLEQDEPSPHASRFCLKKLRLFQDEDVLEDVLKNLGKLVVVTPQVVNYLVHIAKHTLFSDYQIANEISAFLQQNQTCYDWQEMWLLHCLNRIGYFEAGSVSNIREFLMSKKSIHDAVAVNAMLIIGKHGDNGDKNWLLELYEKEHSIWVKRAILYALKNLSPTKRNHFYSYCTGSDPLTDKIIEYVKNS